MNNLIAALSERIAAVWIERIAGSKITTIAGILGIMATFVGQLTTYIPTPYNTYVSLAGVVLAGVAAILARDNSGTPASTTTATNGTTSTAKLGVLALCALLLSGTMPLVGCTESQVAQNIVNWTPTLQSTVATVDTTAAMFLPTDAAIFAAVTVGFDAAAGIVVAEAKAYLANPSASVLAQLQTAIVTLQQKVNTAILSAAKITNTNSQQLALAALNGVATAVTAILTLTQSISSKAAVAQMSSQSTIKLAAVRPFLNEGQSDAMVAHHYGEPVEIASYQVASVEKNLARAGF